MKNAENTHRFRSGMLTYEDNPYPDRPDDITWDMFWKAWIGKVEKLKARKHQSSEITLTKEQIKSIKRHIQNINRRQTASNIADEDIKSDKLHV